VLPGFVTLLIGERTHVVRVRDRSPFELLLIATYYSVVCWVIVGLATWPFELTRSDLQRMYRQEELGELALLGLLALLGVPVVVATVERLWRRSRTVRPWLLRRLRIHEGHAIPTAWDDVFRRGRPAMVRVVLTDGRVVGGYYGSQSFAPYAAEGQDLMLESRWELDSDHWFVAPAPGTQGLWLSSGSIVSIELYDPAT
jgi:hypothetical protein